MVYSLYMCVNYSCFVFANLASVGYTQLVSEIPILQAL